MAKMHISCLLGKHTWKRDSGMFVTALKCCNCPAVESQRDADELARERTLHAKHSGLSGKAFIDAMRADFKAGRRG